MGYSYVQEAVSPKQNHMLLSSAITTTKSPLQLKIIPHHVCRSMYLCICRVQVQWNLNLRADIVLYREALLPSEVQNVLV